MKSFSIDNKREIGKRKMKVSSDELHNANLKLHQYQEEQIKEIIREEIENVLIENTLDNRVAKTIRKFSEVLDAAAKQKGFSPSDDILWAVITKKKWNPKRAMEFQEDSGYDPKGYSFFDFKSKPNNKGSWTSTWACQASSG